MRSALLVLLVLLVMLAACGGPTPYGPADADGLGYRETALDERRYLISVAGNYETPADRIALFLLYRAAELADQAGAHGFEVLRRDTESLTAYRSANGGSILRGNDNPRYRDYPRAAASRAGYVYPVTRYRGEAEIRLIEADDPAKGSATAYEAAALLARLGASLGGR